MKYIIHDLGNESIIEQYLENELKISAGSDEYTIIDASKAAAKCVGCFKCWLDKPSKCVFKDHLEFIGKKFMTSEEVIVITKALYGGLSVPVKRLFDRVIPGVLPFFIEKNNEQHHAQRYKNNPKLKVAFYNKSEMTEDEILHARNLIHAVSLNFNADKYDVYFNDGQTESLNAIFKGESDNGIRSVESLDSKVSKEVVLKEEASVEFKSTESNQGKILIIGTSPRKSASTSLYLGRMIKRKLGSANTEIINLKSAADYNRILELLPDVNTLVFATPVYVDSIPSTTLDYLKKLEDVLKSQKKKLPVYAVLNCGFYEGHQCQHALETYSLWCERAGQKWMGGLGIGGGVMIGFIRFLPAIAVVCLVLEYVIRAIILALSAEGFSMAGLFDHFMPINFVIQCLVFLLCSMGAFVNTSKMAKAIKSRAMYPVKFTTVWFCPRFLFVILATTYWFVRALILHLTMPWQLFKK